MSTMSIKRYSEMVQLKTFKDRFEYLKCGGTVGVQTFGSHRYLNQMLYMSQEWKSVRRKVIIRDGGFDLACEDVPIAGKIYIHHINPITIEDVLERRGNVFDMDNLISCSLDTHNALHYGSDCPKEMQPVIREQYDTCPWR